MACVGRCGAYGSRPQMCQDYPTVSSFIPPGCTFYFHNGVRHGSCQPKVCGDNNCCSYPREGGEPEAKTLDELAGGLPCKHLRWEEEESSEDMEKDADASELVPFEGEINSLIAEVLHDIR